MQTYTKRTNAKRAAIKAGVAEDQVEITVHKDGGKVRFGWTQGEQAVSEDAPVFKEIKKTRKTSVLAATTTAAKREVRNGVKKPNPGGKCAAVWDALDEMVAKGLTPDTAAIREWAAKHKANENNAVIEFYGWRRWSGLSGKDKKAA